MTVAGDKVVRVSPALRFPDRYRDQSARDMAVAFVLIFFFGSIAALIGIVRRAQVDTLQWRVMIRLFAFLTALFVLDLVVKLPETLAATRAGAGTRSGSSRTSSCPRSW